MNVDRVKRVAPWAFALVIAMAAPGAFAEDVNLGNTRLTLGAPQTEVMGTVRAQFNVKASQTSGQYFVYSKTMPLARDGQTPSQSNALGSLTFVHGKLVRVSRNLGSFRCQDGQAAIQNMIRAFAEAPTAGSAPSVHTDSRMLGDASTRRVYFQYPDRVIQVVVFQPADQSKLATVDITEQDALAGQGQLTERVPSH